jgi:hypothetical protein
MIALGDSRRFSDVLPKSASLSILSWPDAGELRDIEYLAFTLAA